MIILALRVPFEKLHSLIYIERRTRLCSHILPDIENATYCAICGAKLWNVHVDPIDEYDKAKNTLFGFDLIKHHGFYYISVATTTFIAFTPETIADYTSKKNILREKIASLDIWDERVFGFYIV